ncbi:hypothetical protein ILYODFUR_021982 [Ilyodon furcidens]|uniref:Uncharacterized protein n=1 Tax=Ilyodon furcidens TaxID=33524 RepID=A0ABV0T060_9TELE
MCSKPPPTHDSTNIKKSLLLGASGNPPLPPETQQKGCPGVSSHFVLTLFCKRVSENGQHSERAFQRQRRPWGNAP